MLRSPRLPSTVVLALAGALTVSVASAQRAPRAVSFPELLQRAADLDRLWQPPGPGETCVQYSSYDRRSDAGPEDAEAWYANSDRGQYLRVEERGDRREFVMVDTAGPGFVARIWSANPSGTLRFYFDGAAEPGWTVDFADLVSGRVEGLGEPLAGVRARGTNCHLPIPFAEHLKLTCDTGDFYYQVNVRTPAAGETLTTFAPELLETHAGEVRRFAARLDSGEAAARSMELTRSSVPNADDGVLWEVEREGAGVLRGLRLGVVGPEVAAVSRQVRVVVDCDGERTVDVPFGDFFASAVNLAPWGGRALGVLEDGSGYCLFPMPFTGSLRVALRADGELRAEAVNHAVQFADAESGFHVEPLRFRADWHQERGVSTRPRTDHLVLDAGGGAGRFVGCGLVVRNPTKAWWGEGDERIVVDGEDFPSTFGTGTEDYFGYAWCCPQRFDSPLHAQPYCEGPANFGYTQNVRLQLHDHVPFHESLRFDLEVWHWREVDVDYATTAWWYGEPGTTAGLPELPPAEERRLEPLEPPVSFVAEDALEGEHLRIIEITGGNHSVQDMGVFGGKWSRDGQLWWTDAEPGDELTLAVPVPRDGRYEVQAVFTTARDYGRVRVHFAGEPLGGEIDLYTPDVGHTGVVELGTVELERGEQPLTLEVTGRNPEAVARHMVGLDYLRLVPVDQR